jgi:hypothetical protein
MTKPTGSPQLLLLLLMLLLRLLLLLDGRDEESRAHVPVSGGNGRDGCD